MKKGFPDKLVLMVADTESVLGDPYSIQLFDGETGVYSLHQNEDILTTFIKYVKKRMVPGHQHYVYFHGLDFDLPMLLHKYHSMFSENSFSLSFPQYGVMFECFTGKMTFAKMYVEGLGMVCIYDTFRFVTTSLAAACTDLNLPFQKLPRPEYLGLRAPHPEEANAFREYAMADVYALWELVQWKMDRVRELDVHIPISIAQLASLVFRKKFLPEGQKINFPSIPCVVDSILSYHGGKNGLYTKSPALLRGISGYDINSAYPWAMKMLPSFLGGEYTQVRTFKEDLVGIYTITGTYDYDTYHLFFHHDFEIHPPGRVENLCVTSFELQRALALGWFKPEKIRGWVFHPSESYSPLAGYVDHYYEQKQKHPKESSQYWIAKILLNSLYGKFIQSMDYNQTERIVARVKNGGKIEHHERESIAGGLFQPFLASLITGAVRARLFDFETRYNALHSSTDAILTRETFDSNPALGELKFENRGDCLMVRNKLYLHTKNDEQFERTARKSLRTERREQRSVWGKFALHGFQGDIHTLIKLWKTRKTAYSIDRMVKLKESFKRKEDPLKPMMFHKQERVLDVDWNDYREE
jgi:hypothetical protein